MSLLPKEIELNKIGRMFGLIDQTPIIKLVARIILVLAIILIVLSLIFLIIFGLYYIFIVKKKQRLNSEQEVDGVERGVLLNISTKKFSFIIKSNNEYNQAHDSTKSAKELSQPLAKLTVAKEFKNLINQKRLFTVQNWSPKNRDYIYHYTDKKSAKSILETQCIVPFRSQFGEGVYLTNLPPDQTDEALLSNNWRGDSRFKYKLECAFAFERKHMKLTKQVDTLPLYSNRDIWKSANTINLNQFDFKFILRK